MRFTSLIKFNRSYFLKMLFLLLTGVSGCKKALDINQSPNALTTAPINTVLTNVTLNAGFLRAVTCTGLQVYGYNNLAARASPVRRPYNLSVITP